MSRDTEWVELGDCEIVRVTEKAVLIDVDGSEEWFPRSQIRDGEDDFEAGTVTDIAVTPWIAKEKGIES